MKFYRDKGEKFSCDIDIEGASIDKSHVRLVLEFNNDKTYLFNGKLTSDGRCEVIIPPLKDIDSQKGKAILEVIAESTYFTPWESDFDVEISKKVSIKEVVLLNNNKEELNETKKMVTTVKVKEPTFVKEQIIDKKPISNNNASIKVNVKKETSQSNKMLVKTILEKVAKLTNEQRKKLLETADKYSPSNGTKKWAEKTFENINNINSKLCMYLLENKN